MAGSQKHKAADHFCCACDKQERKAETILGVAWQMDKEGKSNRKKQFVGFSDQIKVWTRRQDTLLGYGFPFLKYRKGKGNQFPG